VLEPDSFNLAGLVPCRLVRVGVDLPEPFARVTLLPDDTSLMEFEIPISIEQARQLALIVAKERAPRPMTAELMQDVLASYGFNVSYVALDEVVEVMFMRSWRYLAKMGGRAYLALVRPMPSCWPCFNRCKLQFWWRPTLWVEET